MNYLKSLVVFAATYLPNLAAPAILETGLIAVVLSVITVVQFPELTLLMPLTAWVVIWTLIMLPTIASWWAKQAKQTGIADKTNPVGLPQECDATHIHETPAERST